MYRVIGFLLVLGLLAGVMGLIEGTYEIYSDGQKVGECTFRLTKHATGYWLHSSTEMTAAGTKTKYEVETFYDEGYHPKNYIVKIFVPRSQQKVEAKFQMGKATVTAGDPRRQTTQTFDFPANGYILDQNIFDHFVPLGKVIDPTVGEFKADVIIPQLMMVVKLDLKNVGEEVVDEKKVTRFSGNVGPFEVNLALREDHVVTNIEYPSQKLKITLTNVKIVERKPHDLPVGFQPITPEQASNKKFMKELRKGKLLKGSIFLNPQGVLDKIYIKRLEQDFDGKIEHDKIEGTIKVIRQSHKITVAGDFPPEKPLKAAEKYSKPEPGIESDFEEIVNKANEVVKKCKTIADAVKAINLWVKNNVECAPQRYSAKEAITLGKGDCHTKARLCVAMLRAVGLPARIVRGVLYVDGKLIDHSWVEVFIGPGLGWAPLDPTTGEVDEISARHISLWLEDDEPPVYAKDIKLEVEKFK